MIDDLTVKYTLKYITKKFCIEDLIVRGHGDCDIDLMRILIMAILKEKIDIALSLSIIDPKANKKFILLNKMQEVTSRIKYKKTDNELKRHIDLFDIDITEIERDAMSIISQAINRDLENESKSLEVSNVV